jgi:hypothetical protein
MKFTKREGEGFVTQPMETLGDVVRMNFDSVSPYLMQGHKFSALENLWLLKVKGKF